ncbi:hypothetical protein G3R49_12420 [Shewanella sp. WXL01]|uniref:DUF1799 domain-containing protein n=1 Tax=Shewanella sp. WXL01 TaxID=2709721 RepID=UPI0014385C1E|nr:DUF1799 domain-containing protein [Shewanella sp. WXL01]NKF51362.1 hypothetical protein [Shewanella sp. WXL01]
MAKLGVTPPVAKEPEPFEFWDEHQSAVEWFIQVQDLMRYQYGAGIAICEGLDVLAVKADAEMSGREFEAEDYLKLRLIGNEVARLTNEKLNNRAS